MDASREPEPKAATPRAPMDFTSPNAPVMAQLAPVTLRPLGLTIISVLCILAGLLGLMSGLMGVANLVFGEMLSNAFVPAAGPAAQTQLQMQTELQAVTRQFLIPNLLLILVQFGVSVGLLVGGIGLLRGRRWARDFTAKTLLAVIGWEVARGILYVIVQSKTYPIISEFTGKIASGAQPGGGETIARMTSIAMIVGGVFWLLWTAAKIGLMLWARSYLHRPAVDEFLQVPATGAAHQSAPDAPS